MPSFEITAPDGKKYAVDAPEGATQDQALAHFKANWKPESSIEVNPKSDFETALEETRKHGPIAKMKEIAAGGLSGIFSPAEQMLKNRGVDTESATFQGGKLGGNVVLGTGVAGGLAKVAGIAGASPALVNALRTSGVEAGGDFGRSAVAGGLTGGVTSALTNPNDTLQGAGIGAVAPSVFGVLGTAATKGYDLASRKLADVNAGKIARETLGDTIERTREALSNAPENLTAAQAAYGKATPAFASMGAMGEKVRGEPYLVKKGASEAENRNIMAAISPNLNAAATNEAQVSANRTAELLRQHNIALANQAGERSAFESSIANPSPTTTGEAITGRKAILERSARDAVKPLYTEAYEAAPNPFSLKPIEDIAKGIKGNIATLIDPNVAPDVVDKAQKLFGASNEIGTPATFNFISGAVPAKAGATKAAEGTLADVHELRSAVNSALSAIKGDPNLAKTDRNLKLLKSGIDSAIEQGIPEDALSKYKQANSTFKTTVVEPYLKGEVSKLTRLNSVGTPILASSKVAAKFLSSPTEAQQFTLAFKNDPEAIKNLEQGIEGIFYNSVVKGAKTPEKFISDNSHALDELDNLGINLKGKLTYFGRTLQETQTKENLLKESGKAITPQVANELAVAPSAANQARILREYSNVLHPNAATENANAFLSAMGSGKEALLKRATGVEGNDLGNYLTDIGQLSGLNTIEAKLLRDAELAQQAEAGKGTLATAVKEHTFMQKLPPYLNPKISTANKAIGITEDKIASAIERKISTGMESPESALKMLNYMPSDQRKTIINKLRQSSPAMARAVSSFDYEGN